MVRIAEAVGGDEAGGLESQGSALGTPLRAFAPHQVGNERRPSRAKHFEDSVSGASIRSCAFGRVPHSLTDSSTGFASARRVFRRPLRRLFAHDRAIASRHPGWLASRF